MLTLCHAVGGTPSVSDRGCRFRVRALSPIAHPGTRQTRRGPSGVIADNDARKLQRFRWEAFADSVFMKLTHHAVGVRWAVPPRR